MTIKINDQISVSPQVAPEALAGLKDEGFQVVISNRPDGEEIGQPLTSEMQAAAEAAGMEFVHIPIVSGQFTEQAVQAMQDQLAKGQKIFAYCRTGTRCAGLWALSQAGQQTADEILATTRQAGYDFPMFADYLKSKDPSAQA